MADVLVRIISKKVSRPVVIIQDGEVHVTDLPADPTETALFLRGRIGNDFDVIRTASGIDAWVDDEYLHRHERWNTLAVSIVLSLGGKVVDIRGPVVLAGHDDTDTVPLTEHQLRHVLMLAAAIHVPIRTIP